MSDKEKSPPDDPAQSQRFINMAREVEADEDPEVFENAFSKVTKADLITKTAKRIRKKQG